MGRGGGGGGGVVVELSYKSPIEDLNKSSLLTLICLKQARFELDEVFFAKLSQVS